MHREEVCRILCYADANRIPVTAWGSGTSMEGNPIPVHGGLVMDFSRMNRILDIRETDFQADVEPGVIYQDLNDQLKFKGLFFPPDPGTRATLGGMIANNASGPHAIRYGSTKECILRLVLVLANGDIIELGTRAAKTSSGYDLLHLFVGSEGTLGLVVEATLRLTGRPDALCAAVAAFPSLETAGNAVREIIRAGLDPAALELMGPECIPLMNRAQNLELDALPTLFMEFQGPSRHHLGKILELAQGICRDAGSVAFQPGLGRDAHRRIFQARHGLGESILRHHPGCRVRVVDVAVPAAAYADIIRHARQEMHRSRLTGYIFSHAGDGNLHLNLVGKKGDRRVWKRIEGVAHRMVEKALACGGTATGEHGVGIGKRGFMEAEHGKSLEWMRRIKALFDPNGILNPGKVFP
jgi:D-lactate dehydrogenase (cytochrome)